MDSTTQPLKQSFSPLINDNSRLLILGTLPGEDSLKYQQYYGHPRNAFWRIISETFAIDLNQASYQQKTAAILDNHLALWDTLGTAKRVGSLDSNIREPQFNDIFGLLRDHPSLQAIGFNGKQARKYFQRYQCHHPPLLRSVTLHDLPSTSPAYTLAYEKKLAVWQAFLATQPKSNRE